MRIINLLFLYRDAHTGSVTEQEAKWRSTIKEKEEAAEAAKAKLTKVTSLPKVHQPLTHPPQSPFAHLMLFAYPSYSYIIYHSLTTITQDLKAAQAALREQEEVAAKVAAEAAAHSDSAEEAEQKAATARREAEAAKKAVETAKSQAKKEVEEAKRETEEARKSAEDARSEARKEVEKAVAAALANAGASPNTIRKTVDEKR